MLPADVVAGAVEVLPFDVKAIGSAITKTKITTPRIINETIAMRLNHMDWKIDVLSSLLSMLKKERLIFSKVASTTSRFTYFDCNDVLDCFHWCLTGVHAFVVYPMMG